MKTIIRVIVVLVFLFPGLIPAALSQDTITPEIVSSEFIFTQPPFKQCHAPTIVETADGSLMAAWFAGSYEGATDVCIWGSRQEGGQWMPPRQLVCGHSKDGNALPCWNPVLFAPTDSCLFLFYKQGISPREWEGMMIISRDNGQTWSWPVSLEGRTGPVKNKPLVTEAGTWIFSASRETTDHWQVFMERSDDRGKTWNVIPVDTANPVKVIQPALLQLPDGKILALCRSNQDRIMCSWSADDGKSWTPLENTEVPNPNSGIDAVSMGNGKQLLVYNPLGAGKDWWNGRNRLSVALSDYGSHWKQVLMLEDQEEGEFSYPAVIRSEEGFLHIVYTYNR